MHRFIDHYLLEWKQDPYRRSLLLRGARQVGKTYAARQLGETYSDFIEINFEMQPQFIPIFEGDLHPERIIRELSIILDRPIRSKDTLLFFDEIQACPKAFLALRYFYELMPELHVIAAGSLLDFTIEQVGIPVGRVSSLYMYPLSFIEFLLALGAHLLIDEIFHHDPLQPLSEVIHKKALSLLAEYLAVGGMPAAVKCWVETKDIFGCFPIYHALIDTYLQDFNKYAKKYQLKYLNALFKSIPRQIGKKFRYSAVEGEFRKRELAPCLDLLETAGIVHKVIKSYGQGIPLGAQVDPEVFKVLCLDVALTQALLGLNLGQWLVNSFDQFVNKGELIETFVGQELLAYANPLRKAGLYYWQRAERGSQAEIDYLIQCNEHVIPIEVKSGTGGALKSMHLFLREHTKTPYGLHFSRNNYSYSVRDRIYSYPLYAIAAAIKNPILEKIKAHLSRH